jgi:hypothetical protein
MFTDLEGNVAPNDPRLQNALKAIINMGADKLERSEANDPLEEPASRYVDRLQPVDWAPQPEPLPVPSPAPLPRRAIPTATPGAPAKPPGFRASGKKGVACAVAPRRR